MNGYSIRDLEPIVGRYNPIMSTTKDSYTFSFKNKNDLKSAKVSYNHSCQNSIYCYQHCGPVFVNLMVLGAVVHFPIQITKFFVIKYEIFQVSKENNYKLLNEKIII